MIKTGKMYKVSLSIRTQIGETRKVRVTVGEEGNDYTSYGEDDIIVNGTLKLYNFTFQMNETTDYNAAFTVSMGDFEDNKLPLDVVIDDIMVVEVQ